MGKVDYTGQLTEEQPGLKFLTWIVLLLYIQSGESRSGFICTEGDGLWTSTDIHAASPTFQAGFQLSILLPMESIFNPYNSSEMWVTSFGNGMKVASLLPTGIEFHAALTDEFFCISKSINRKFRIVVPKNEFIQEVAVYDLNSKLIYIERVKCLHLI